jgi:hypothetical protein
MCVFFVGFLFSGPPLNAATIEKPGNDVKIFLQKNLRYHQKKALQTRRTALGARQETFGR